MIERRQKPRFKIGFTGTSNGMSQSQLDHLRKIFEKGYVAEFHHGDCVGADEQAHNIALEFKERYHIKIVIHPPDNPKMRAYCRGASELRHEKPYLVRNHDIVDETEFLIAAPKTDQEELRSGTWATVRYAKKIGRRLGILSR